MYISQHTNIHNHAYKIESHKETSLELKLLIYNSRKLYMKHGLLHDSPLRTSYFPLKYRVSTMIVISCSIRMASCSLLVTLKSLSSAFTSKSIQVQILFPFNHFPRFRFVMRTSNVIVTKYFIPD